jgi:hypothetical protein
VLRAQGTAIEIYMGINMPGRQTYSVLMGALSVVLAVTFGEARAAQGHSCSPKDAEAADAAVDRLDSWKKIDWAFRKYGHCDDGSIAEGNSEAVARLLVDQWDTLPALLTLVKRDPELKQFVLRHVDTTLDTDDLEKIEELAASNCPGGATLLCKELRTAAVRAAK